MSVTYIVAYHHPCTDGAYAALAAYRKLNRPDENVIFVPHNTRAPLAAADLPAGDVLYLLDYCGSGAAFLTACTDSYAQVVLIDHHKTALDIVAAMGDLPRNLTTVLDMQHSACALAVRYFESELTAAERNIFSYVEDNDLWKHALSDSQLFTAGLNELELDYDFSDIITRDALFAQLSNVHFQDAVERGRVEYDHITALINTYMGVRHTIELKGTRMAAVCISDAEHGIISRLGHELALVSPSHIGAIHSNGRVALRSTDESADCTAIATAYGGGGHACAAGFTLTREEWDGAFVLTN